MQTTLKKLLSAYTALEAMKINAEIPYRTLRQINKLKKSITDEITIGQETQKKVVADFKGEINGDSITFPPGVFADYNRRWSDIENEVYEVDIEMIDISELTASISFNGITDTYALEEFIKME